MWEHFTCFSVKILDYYNITVHSLVCNELSESIMHGAAIKITSGGYQNSLGCCTYFLEFFFSVPPYT